MQAWGPEGICVVLGNRAFGINALTAQPPCSSCCHAMFWPSVCPLPSIPAGGQGAGKLLLGGADPSLAAGPFVTTPLQPNRWRTDFITGEDVFVFWQFTPRYGRMRISVS
jgi:hypothetical protein